MIREILRPNSNNFTISIPNEYVNQKVEFIMFPLEKDESVQEIKQQDISILAGCLNKYANCSKMDLENKAWELHMRKKYYTTANLSSF